MIPPKRTIKLRQDRFQKPGHSHSEWVIKVEEGTTIEDILKPEYWSHIANRIGKFDKITAIFDDGSYYLELIILEVDNINKTPVWAKAKLILKVELAENLEQAKEDKKAKKDKEASVALLTHLEYTLKWRGAKKYSIIRNSDGAVMQEDLKDKQAANKALEELIKKLS